MQAVKFNLSGLHLLIENGHPLRWPFFCGMMLNMESGDIIIQGFMERGGRITICEPHEAAGDVPLPAKRGRRRSKPEEICILEQIAQKKTKLQQLEARFNFHPDNIQTRF